MMYALLVLVLALQVVSMVTVHWSVKTGNGQQMQVGLWKWCLDTQNGSPSCTDLPPSDMSNFPKNSLYAVRALVALSAVLVVSAIVCLSMGKGKCLPMLLGVAGISSLAANVVWAKEMMKFTFYTGNPNVPTIEVKTRPCYSFWLNMLAGLGAIGLAMVPMKGKSK